MSEKKFHGVPVHRHLVAAISTETGASAAEVIRELSATFTPEALIAIRDKLRKPQPQGLLEKALGEKVA